MATINTAYNEPTFIVELSLREACLLFSVLAQVSKVDWVYEALEALDADLEVAGIDTANLPGADAHWAGWDEGINGASYYTALGELKAD